MRASSYLPLLVLVAACSSSPPAETVTFPPVDVEPPPSGSLSAQQLAVVADDIREIGDNPLGAGADAARRELFRWITGSPDVSVTICARLMAPFSGNDNEADILLIHYPLNVAEQVIRNPEASRLAHEEAAIADALDTYQVLLDARGRRARAPGLEVLIRARQDGNLRAWVEEALSEC